MMMAFSDRTSRLEIDSCPECFGLWFDGDELSRFFQSPELSERILGEEATLAVLTPTLAPAAKAKAENRICPACQEPLFGSSLGQTQIDYCLACRGVWLDKRELEQLVSAFQAGERGNLLIVNQLIEGLGTPARPNPRAADFLETLGRYRRSLNPEGPGT
jgi:Zn-finger nucleic acid-binding protein